MFIINTTTSVEFDQNLWCLSQIITDFQNLWGFGLNTTDFGQIPQILSGDFGWRVVLCNKKYNETPLSPRKQEQIS